MANHSILASFVVLFCACNASASDATDARATGFRGGLRVGYGAPFGKAPEKVTIYSRPRGSQNLRDQYSAAIVAWLDVGYALTPEMQLGLYGVAGMMFVSAFDESAQAGCPIGTRCHAYDFRFGPQFQYHVLPGARIDPWMGLGVGYELVHAQIVATDVEASKSFGGFEIVNLQAGADLAVSGELAVGPFVSMSVGHYSTEAAQENNGLHEWLVVGVRASLPH